MTEEYTFWEGLPEPTIEFEFEQTLFNTYLHRLLQASQGWISFFILNQKHKRVSAIIHFYCSHGTAKSPLNSPFGSVEFADTLPPTVLYQFLIFVEAQLKLKNVESIIIKTPPQLYHSEKASLIYTFLFNHNYQVRDAEVGAVIEVIEDDMHNHLHEWERRRLRQGKEAGFTFKQLDPSTLEKVYVFIANCRSEKGFVLSMTLVQLTKAITVLPEHYLLFGVFKGDELIAASISVLITDKILYNFYVDHKMEYDQLSPVVFLVNGIYQFCQSKNIKLLDLGTSAVNGTPNFGLLDFKMHLGAKPTLKLTFEKKVNNG